MPIPIITIIMVCSMHSLYMHTVISKSEMHVHSLYVLFTLTTSVMHNYATWIMLEEIL